MYPLKFLINPYHVKFLKWNNPSYIYGTFWYNFKVYQDEILKLVSQQIRAWSDYTDVQAGLALYWWQRLIIFGVGRIRVKLYFLNELPSNRTWAFTKLLYKWWRSLLTIYIYCQFFLHIVASAGSLINLKINWVVGLESTFLTA